MSSNNKLIRGISEQFVASLKMLENIIIECKDELWEDYNRDIIISQVVYHTLANTDFYLSRTKEEIDFFKDKYDVDDAFENKSNKFTKKQLLEYLKDIRVKSNKLFKEITIEELNEDPIFDWGGSSVTGSILYNLRHLTIHTGALHVRLNEEGKKPLKWIDKISEDEQEIDNILPD